jgi:regulator of protease activity HflC (stomatin/prohibitin superfamily)
MYNIKMSIIAGSFLTGLLIAGCGSSPVVVDQESTTSSIRAAEEVGASNISNASLYLQLAKEQLVKAQTFAANGEKEKAELMLLRATADGELAVALSRSDADKKEAIDAIERVKQLRQDNNLTNGRN